MNGSYVHYLRKDSSRSIENRMTVGEDDGNISFNFFKRRTIGHKLMNDAGYSPPLPIVENESADVADDGVERSLPQVHAIRSRREEREIFRMIRIPEHGCDSGQKNVRADQDDGCFEVPSQRITNRILEHGRND